ncbi:hypothetical protein AAC691_13085 [Nguyenibacter vanlangensis]|uniref:Aspartyl protease n=1 Tax=Nguyenibacter vanlangensis TaxID=1216886 RepID=A0ABZ3D0G1_9PROT
MRKTPIFVGLFLLRMAAPGPLRAAESPRIVVPIQETVLSDGARRYSITLSFGGARFDAALDTGSTGLRILPRTVDPQGVLMSERTETYGFGSGTVFDGVIGHGRVGFGDTGNAIAGAVPVQMITHVRCHEDNPKCPASRVDADDYEIEGDGLPHEGFRAILGLRTSQGAVPNPLLAIGVRRWIIDLPLDGIPRTGWLILNPTDDEIAGFVKIPMLPQFGNARRPASDIVPGCLENLDTHSSICGGVLADTGAPGVTAVFSGRDEEIWPAGTRAALTFGQADHTVQARETLTIGRRAHASALKFVRWDLPINRVFAGLCPYFAFSILYDPANLTVGFKPRDAPPGGPVGEVNMPHELSGHP